MINRLFIFLTAGLFMAITALAPWLYGGTAFDLFHDPVKGNPRGKVTIIEYSDFQCPACAAMYTVLKGILKRYPEDIRVIYRNYPLTRIHRWAYLAAMAGECAYERGKFWEFHDILFERQDSWANSSNAMFDFLMYAGELGMNKSNFRACIESEKAIEMVEADRRKGRRLNINATPTFFINGRRYVGVWNIEEFDFIVRRAIRNKE